jgi:UDP-N-acetylmuramoylalanine--D-glutamate ligase
VQALAARQTPLLSELELAYRYCLCPIVAITGTNGKTTTTELMAAALAGCGRRAIAAGNNGNAFSAMVEGTAALDAVVLEVSSFQLERIEQFRPQVSVLLNLRPDHLDRYRSMDDYVRAKARIFLNQREDDVAVINAECLERLMRQDIRLPGRVITFSATGRPADLWLDLAGGGTIWSWLPECRGIVLRLEETNLRGPHNAENMLATLAAAIALELPVRHVRAAIADYCPAPHRCEVVANINGVTYINDSKATNVDAVEKALLSLPGRVILIAGGRDKELDFAAIAGVVRRQAKLAVVIGEAQDKIVRAWGEAVPCIRAFSLAEAVQVAAARAVPGDTVLLSPACASFDMFENYEHRGEVFKRYVINLR